jgi:hypothetical protein
VYWKMDAADQALYGGNETDGTGLISVTEE